MSLNATQRKVVDYLLEGDRRIAMIQAGPGTGKTYTAVKCAIEFIEKQLYYNSQYKRKVLILTFSKNARAQIERQLELIPVIQKVKELIEITNFHALYQKYISAYSLRLKIKSDKIIILSENQRKKILQDRLQEIKELDLGKNNQYDWVDNLLEYDLYPKGSRELKRDVMPILKYKNKIISELKAINSEGLIGFSDMGYLTLKLFKSSPSLLNIISYKYPLLIIDEYQDVSDNQDELIDLLSIKNNSVLYFADSSQQIYEWRGARHDRVEKRSKRHGENILTDSFTENYRFGEREDILKYIEELRAKRNVELDSSENIKVVDVEVKVSKLSLNSPESKFKMMNAMFYKIMGNLPSYKDRKNKSIGILCRTNSQVEYYKKKFSEKSIKTKNINNNDIEHNIIGDMISFMNNKDYYSKEELTIEGIRYIFSIIAEKKISSLSKNKVDEIEYSKLLKMKKPIIKSIILISEKYYMSSDIIGYYNELTTAAIRDDDVSIDDDIILLMKRIFLQKSNQNKVMDVFLMHQYLQSHVKLEGIYLLNYHQSKGREFDYVFVIDENGLRRDKNLYYVAMSRVKDKLVIFNWIKSI